MSKEEPFDVDGVVTTSHVLLDNGQEILALSSGRLRRNRIGLLVGDRARRSR